MSILLSEILKNSKPETDESRKEAFEQMKETAMSSLGTYTLNLGEQIRESIKALGMIVIPSHSSYEVEPFIPMTSRGDAYEMAQMFARKLKREADRDQKIDRLLEVLGGNGTIAIGDERKGVYASTQVHGNQEKSQEKLSAKRGKRYTYPHDKIIQAIETFYGDRLSDKGITIKDFTIGFFGLEIPQSTWFGWRNAVNSGKLKRNKS